MPAWLYTEYVFDMPHTACHCALCGSVCNCNSLIRMESGIKERLKLLFKIFKYLMHVAGSVFARKAFQHRTSIAAWIFFDKIQRICYKLSQSSPCGANIPITKQSLHNTQSPTLGSQFLHSTPDVSTSLKKHHVGGGC